MSLPSLEQITSSVGSDMRVTRCPILDQGTAEEKRLEILLYFHKTFSLYEKLFELVADDSTLYERPEPLRHPLIFYLGHTACFFINKLLLAGLVQRIDEEIESDLAIGVDEMSWDDIDVRTRHWPSAERVRDYRQRVRVAVDQVIRTAPLTMPITWHTPFWTVVMGIEHERIHLETSSVLLRRLPLDRIRADSFWAVCKQHGTEPANQLVDIEQRTVKLGKDHSYRLYGWDNEFGRHTAQVDRFQAAQFLCTNGEFLAFVAAGGYGQRQYWTNDGWRYIEFQHATAPLFWRLKPGADAHSRDAWRLRTMIDEIDMPWDWPVEVNYLEAKAFCNWKTAVEHAAGRTHGYYRLPSEDEWYALHAHAGLADSDQPDWHTPLANINLEQEASSCPVTRNRHGQLYDVIGNVWQWTETYFYGFEGFQVHPHYDDFSVPTFDGQHNIIKGGSWMSTGNEACIASRYAFRQHFYQHAGFRYVLVDAAHKEVEQFVNYYDTDAAVAQYLEFHFGDDYFGVPNFAKAVADLCLDRARQCGVSSRAALDIGCAVGRSTLELATYFERVVGVDFSTRFIKEGFCMQQRGSVTYQRQIEGDISQEITRQSPVTADVAARCQFVQGDACNLHAHLRDFDLVLAANLIDRVNDPLKFLNDIATRINSGGLLVITSPYTWLADYTKRDKWLGGFMRDGQPVRTIDTLHQVLAANFEPVGEPVDVPFVIRETARKHQHTVAQASVWRRR